MKNVDQIIQELFTLEPSLRSRERELRTLVSQLLSSKPNTKFDATFAARLRAELLGSSVLAVPIRSSWLGFPRLLVAAGSLAAITLIIVAANSLTPAPRQGLSFEQQFTATKNHGFGSLSVNTSGKGGATDQVQSVSSANPSVDSKSSAPASTLAAPSRMAVSVEGGAGYGGASGATIVPTPAIYPGFADQLIYVYKGTAFTIPKEGVVYKRVKGEDARDEFITELKAFNLGLIDLLSFDNLKLLNFEVAENKTSGYQIDVNTVEGSVSINPDYQEWPAMKGEVPVGARATLSEKEIIAIAEQFIQDHGINRSIYGDPIVQKMPDYRMMGTREVLPPQASEGFSPAGSPQDLATPSSDSKMMPIYMPEVVTVTFPLIIKGLPVYESGGYPYGLQVSVSVRERRVYSVNNLTSQHYDASSYPLISDPQKVLSYLTSGGIYGSSYYPEGMQVRKIYLEAGTPSNVLMHYYSYANGENQELYVPALLFPITKAPAGQEYYYPSSILIPLAEDLFNQPEPRPMPMMEKGVILPSQSSGSTM